VLGLRTPPGQFYVFLLNEFGNGLGDARQIQIVDGGFVVGLHAGLPHVLVTTLARPCDAVLG
jgi:hypothetical protein